MLQRSRRFRTERVNLGVQSSGVRLRRLDSASAWNALVDAAPNSTPFHRVEFLSEMADLFGWRFRPMLADLDGVAVGIVPLLALRRVRITPRAPFPYVGPLVPEGLLEPVLMAVRRWQYRSGHPVARLALAPTANRPQLRSSHLELAARTTYVLDLGHGSLTEYEAGLRPDRRQALRRAARNGVRAAPTRAGEVASLLPGLMRGAYSRHDAASPYPAGVAAWIDEGIANGTVQAVTARAAGEPVGLLVALRQGDRMFGWIGATERSGLSRDAGTVAYDALIRSALDAGARQFDFVGHVDDGVSRFKRSFGAAPVPYWDITSSVLPFDQDRAITAGRRLAARFRR